jgi:cytochrome c5
VAGVPSVPLGDLAGKTTVDELSAFLLDPRVARPAGRMPTAWLAPDEARAIAVWLLRAQLAAADAAEPVARAGLAYEYFEHACKRLPDCDTLEPAATGIVERVTLDVPGRRDEEFVLRFRGEIEVPVAGRWRFWTRSDDGSRLWIDGEPVVDNDGEHAAETKGGRIELTAGPHAFELTFFERHGGEHLAVEWAGPDRKREPIPAGVFSTSVSRPMQPLGMDEFVPDPQRAARGRTVFARRCAACHEPEAATGPAARPLAALDPRSPRGCLGGDPHPDVARYAFEPAQVAELAAALREQPWRRAAPTAAERVRRRLAAHACTACHQRSGIGGPEEERHEDFRTKIPIDLGDEGRFPPSLDGVGGKLRKDALRRLLVDGAHHIRGEYMATRMPGFAAEPMAQLVDDLVAADRGAAGGREPPFDPAAVDAGRRLVGLGGFTCITCHAVNGNRGIGIPGIDLATAHDRLDPEWFRRFLRNPAALRPGTRMPAFWAGATSGFGDILGGDSARQIDAVWTYLSLGASIPPPRGVVPNASVDAPMELVPTEEPIVHRTFMMGVGPRSILVGHPEGVHVAFDAHAVLLAKAWRGRFFDQSGVASGRTDTRLGPLGRDVLDVSGPALARLESTDAPWPVVAENVREVGGRFLGYRLDRAGRPAFRYRLGGVLIEEQVLPVLAPGGANLRRVLSLAADAPPRDLVFLAWAGAAIEPLGDGGWRCDGGVTVTLRAAGVPRVRDTAERRELLVPMVFEGGRATIEEVIAW